MYIFGPKWSQSVLLHILTDYGDTLHMLRYVSTATCAFNILSLSLSVALQLSQILIEINMTSVLHESTVVMYTFALNYLKLT